MDEIAAEAGTSKTVIYRHLGDRLGLYLAVCESVDALILAEIDAAGPVPPDPWDSRLQRLNDGVIRRIRALSARIVPP